MWAKQKQQTGFTIVELMIVIVVIAILTAITLVSYKGMQDRSKAASVQADLHNIRDAMMLYRAEHGTLPLGRDWYSGTTMPPSSRWATEIIAQLRSQNYLSGTGLEKDPWGQYYWYDNNDCTFGGNGSTPVQSVGPDGLLRTADDIGITIKTTC